MNSFFHFKTIISIPTGQNNNNEEQQWRELEMGALPEKRKLVVGVPRPTETDEQ